MLGTILGVAARGIVANPDVLGLDAIFPDFFLGLLAVELRRRQGWPVAALGAWTPGLAASPWRRWRLHYGRP